MIALTARQIAHIVGGRVAAGSPDFVYRSLQTDSRSLSPGDLFVALVGARFDGHEFIADAFAAGATGVLASRPVPPHDPWPEPETAPAWIEVADTQRALEDLARALRDFHAARVVAVTGSVGKTTVKDMIAAALEGVAPSVLKTPGNLNNHIGLPLTLARASGAEAYLVLELGMSAHGEIARLTHIARPHVGIVTRAAAAHLEFFESIDAIADAKAELWEHLPVGGRVVVNADDARLLARATRAVVPNAGAAITTYGVAPGATIRLASAEHGGAGLVVTLATPVGDLTLGLATVGLHNAHNAAGAIAVCHALGLDLAACAAALGRGFRAPKHRLERLAIGGVQVLDDCYNANPTSTKAALETFEVCATNATTKIAVLGSNRELGPDADQLHHELGAEAARRGVTHLFATGPHAAAIASGAASEGLVATTAKNVKDLDEAVTTVATPGAWLLLKGSRGEGLEHVLDVLRVHYGEAA